MCAEIAELTLRTFDLGNCSVTVFARSTARGVGITPPAPYEVVLGFRLQNDLVAAV